jgi:hypothetical protein
VYIITDDDQLDNHRIIENHQLETKDNMFDDDEETISNNNLNNSNNSDLSSSTANDKETNNNANTNDNNNKSKSNHSELISQLDKSLINICQFCQLKCSEIINSKTEDNSFTSKVSFEEFSDLVKLIEKFTSCNESICSQNIPQLKLALRTQTNKYVTKFHDDHRKSIISLLEIEQWKSFVSILLLLCFF